MVALVTREAIIATVAQETQWVVELGLSTLVVQEHLILHLQKSFVNTQVNMTKLSLVYLMAH